MGRGRHKYFVGTSRTVAARKAATSSAAVANSFNPHAINGASKTEVLTSANLKDYLAKYWIVVFGLNNQSDSTQLAEIRRYMSWYGGRHMMVPLERHTHAKALINQIVEWRTREEMAAKQEVDDRRLRLQAGRLLRHKGPDGELTSSSHNAPISAEPTKTRHLFSRSNLTDFGSLYISPKPIPAIFVNQHYLGGLEDLQVLERQKKLKDIIQFGFEWKTNKFLNPVASLHDDKALFKAQYLGEPLKRPIAMLPQISTRFNVDDPYDG